MLDNNQVARRSNRELMDVIAASGRQMASLAATIIQHAGELDRREGWRDDGATSLEDWLVGHLGVSKSTAKVYAHLSERLFDLPHLAAGLGEGDLSLDKVRTLVDTATPETDRDLARQARELTVRELAVVARTKKKPSEGQDQIDHDKRSLRFNDVVRTVTAQLPPTSYAEVKACLEARARRLPSDGETPLDQRLADAFMELIRTSGRRSAGGSTGYTVVAHVPLEVLTDPDVTLCGELDGVGLISADTVRELFCDATLIVAADDDKGHTMYEGRGERLATAAQRRELARRDRHCRFPGCANTLFVIPHHLHEFRAGGKTDLPNMALLCAYHHHLIHSKLWSVSGNANEELRFVGPDDQVLISRPSPLWALVTDPETRPRRNSATTNQSGPNSRSTDRYSPDPGSRSP
jgi:hypothetical protein